MLSKVWWKRAKQYLWHICDKNSDTEPTTKIPSFWEFLQHGVNHESKGLIRVAENLVENFNINTNDLDHNAKTANLF